MIFKQHKTSEKNPGKSGWYDTDKGYKYFYLEDEEWRVYHSYSDFTVISNPSLWYEQQQKPDINKEVNGFIKTLDSLEEMGLKNIFIKQNQDVIDELRKHFNKIKQKPDVSELKDRFYNECTDKEYGNLPNVNLNPHNLFKWIVDNCLQKEAIDKYEHE